MVYDDESTEIAVRLGPDSIRLNKRSCDFFFWSMMTSLCWANCHDQSRATESRARAVVLVSVVSWLATKMNSLSDQDYVQLA